MESIQDKVTLEDYEFRSVVSADLPMLSEWLREPEVVRWYEDPDYIDELEKHLTDTRISMQLVLFRTLPIAYVQDYDIHAWPEHHLAYLPERSRGIDTFIGAAEAMGKGHGSNFLLLRVRQLFADGIPALGIDPHPGNAWARRAYQKVGFSCDGQLETRWGEVMLMSLLATHAR